MDIVIDKKDFDWLIKYIDAFMDWDALGYFLTIKDVNDFKDLKERYK